MAGSRDVQLGMCGHRMAADGNAHSWGTRLPAKSPQHQAFSQEQVGALGAAGGASVKTAWGLEAPEPPPHLRRPVSTSSRLTSVSPPNPGARGRNPHAWGHLSAQGLCRHHSWRIFWFLPQLLAVPSLRRVLIPVLIKPGRTGDHSFLLVVTPTGW